MESKEEGVNIYAPRGQGVNKSKRAMVTDKIRKVTTVRIIKEEKGR